MNYSAIKEDVYFHSGATSATYPSASLNRNINFHYHDTVRKIWEADGDWHYDDSNNTSAPIAYRTLANLSASYQVPTTAIRIEGVEIKDANSNWSKLRPVTYAELTQSPEEYRDGGGLPVEYMLEGNEIRLFPYPKTGEVTMTSGMAVHLARNVTEFPASASTAEPGLPAAFHRLLSLGAAIDFIRDDGEQRKWLLTQKERLEQGLVRFYSKRASQYKTQIKPAGRRGWRKFI